MRLFLFFVFVGLICVTLAEQQQQQKPVGNTITRFFSNWFGKKTQNNKPNVADPLTQDDFNSQLPKQSTDKMISDAISQRFLEESRAQESVGSPFIVEPDTPLEPDTALESNDQSDENKEFESSERQLISKPENDDLDKSNRDGKSMANTATDSIPIAEALRIVNTSNLIDCVARVICELSCNANSYGNQGRTVFRNLIKLQFDQSVKSDDAKFFRQAAAKGRQIIQGKRDCNECYSIYPSCKSSSKDLVAVSSMFKL